MLDAAGHMQHDNHWRSQLHSVHLLPREPAGGQPEPRLHLHPDGAALHDPRQWVARVLARACI